jgi:hypothetical protein
MLANVPFAHRLSEYSIIDEDYFRALAYLLVRKSIVSKDIFLNFNQKKLISIIQKNEVHVK